MHESYRILHIYKEPNNSRFATSRCRQVLNILVFNATSEIHVC